MAANEPRGAGSSTFLSIVLAIVLIAFALYGAAILFSCAAGTP